VAEELGLVEQTLGNWVRLEKIDRGEREGLSTEEREEMARLRREVKRLLGDRAIPEPHPTAAGQQRWTRCHRGIQRWHEPAKVYRLVDRFSEDVDVLLVCEGVGTG
jgi:hypothetical protein